MARWAVRRDAEPFTPVASDGVRLSALAYGAPDADVAIVFGHAEAGFDAPFASLLEEIVTDLLARR